VKVPQIMQPGVREQLASAARSHGSVIRLAQVRHESSARAAPSMALTGRTISGQPKSMPRTLESDCQL
jgi:hypothetical protein